jgi:glycosyltransferase involved in cell wall biosynthesis
LFVANTLFYLDNFRSSTLAAMRDRGLRVICFGSSEGPGDRASDNLRAAGHVVVAADWDTRSINPFSELAIMAKLQQLAWRERPLMACSFTFKGNFVTSLVSRINGIAYITNVSGLGEVFLNDTPVNRALRHLYGYANAGAMRTFFQNPGDLATMKAEGLSTGRSTAILPGSGVDLNRFAYRQVDRPIRRFLLVARMMREKGIGEFIAAARMAKAVRPELEFILVGPEDPSPQRAFPAEEIRANSAVVTWLGPASDVVPHLHAADCFVLPSYTEGRPRSVLEAQSTGLPSIVSDVDGNRDAIEPGITGNLFEVRSPEALSAMFLQMADMPPSAVRRMSAAARKHAVDVLDERFCIQPYLDAVDGLEKR